MFIRSLASSVNPVKHIFRDILFYPPMACAPSSFLTLIPHYSHVRCQHRGRLLKGTGDLPVHSLHLSMNLYFKTKVQLVTPKTYHTEL